MLAAQAAEKRTNKTPVLLNSWRKEECLDFSVFMIGFLYNMYCVLYIMNADRSKSKACFTFRTSGLVRINFPDLAHTGRVEIAEK